MMRQYVYIYNFWPNHQTIKGQGIITDYYRLKISSKIELFENLHRKLIRS